MAKGMSVKEKIALRQSQKTLEDKIIEVLSGLSDKELDAAKGILVDLFELKASDVSVNKDNTFSAPKVVEGKVKNKPGRKPKAKVVEVAADAVAADAADAVVADAKPAKAAKAPKAAKAAGRGRTGKYPTIHEEDLRDAVVAILRNSNGELSAKEIRELLYKGAYADHRENPSFQTRFSSLLKKWVEEGLITHGSRGIYALVNA